MKRESAPASLPSPGPFGRLIRIMLAIGAFYFFWVNRRLLHFGNSMTATYWMNWFAVAVGFIGLWTVFTRLFRLPKDMRTKALMVLIYGGSALTDVVMGSGFPGPIFTLVAFGALLIFFLILSISFLLQAVLATPG